MRVVKVFGKIQNPTPKLKKEYIYTSIPTVGLHGLL